MENLKINSALAAIASTKVSSDERANLIHEGRMLLL